MKTTRQSGVLLHPTSLPGPYGIGELGPEAFKFVDFLAEAGQSLWQVLPLGPTGYGDSPYASFSTFAGTPLVISLDDLVKSQDLTSADLAEVPPFPADRTDYGWVQWWKLPLLRKAAQNFLDRAGAERKTAFQTFCREEGHWLDDYALFMAVKNEYQKKAEAEHVEGKMWSNYWDLDIRLREPKAVKAWSERLAGEIAVYKVWQFWFYSQWLAVKTYANAKGVRIIGDIPIFVAADSVDVWANREYFKLDRNGQPTVVAGVPPDYFSATGQLWGNPIYNWPAMKRDKFKWWIHRIKGILKLVDVIRIDHFRGFEAYWEITAGEETAINGHWVKAPGIELFTEVKKQLGSLPILAEDLGLITPEVEHMRDLFEFPGMKILQFAFDSGEAGAAGDNTFLPHNYTRNSVVYTGSHDNDTARGWYESASEADQKFARDYLNYHEPDISWGFIRGSLASASRIAIIPAQDLLNLPSTARMNTPSVLGGNWEWRITPGQLTGHLADRLKGLTKLYGRLPRGTGA